MADRLALWLVARYVVATRLLRDKDDEESFRLLRELCADVVDLRKGDHSAERLRIECEELEFEREQVREKTEEEFWEWVLQPEHREQICRGFRTREEKAKLFNKIFGVNPDWQPPSSCYVDQKTTPSADATNQTKSDQIKPGKDHEPSCIWRNGHDRGFATRCHCGHEYRWVTGVKGWQKERASE